ncbi:MAG: hypothetical protein KC524_11380 [Gammaproteobacteria bacterium]|nr:hypothetical protein [Gammaproteobacteria bacterium]
MVFVVVFVVVFVFVFVLSSMVDRSIAFRWPSFSVLRCFALFFSQHSGIPQLDAVVGGTRASSNKTQLGRHRQKILVNSLTARCRLKLAFTKANPSQASQSACKQPDDKAK